MDAIATTGGPGNNAGTPLRMFLSHTSDLGQPREPESFVATAIGAVLRARHAVTDMAYIGARDASPAAYCTAMVARPSGSECGGPTTPTPPPHQAAATSHGWVAEGTA